MLELTANSRHLFDGSTRKPGKNNKELGRERLAPSHSIFIASLAFFSLCRLLVAGLISLGDKEDACLVSYTEFSAGPLGIAGTREGT